MSLCSKTVPYPWNGNWYFLCHCLLSLPSSRSRLCRSAHWLLSPPPSRLGRQRPDSPARLGTAPHTFPLGPSSTNKRAKPEAGTHGKGHGFEPQSRAPFLCLRHLPVTASNLSGKASSVKKSALFQSHLLAPVVHRALNAGVQRRLLSSRRLLSKRRWVIGGMIWGSWKRADQTGETSAGFLVEAVL